MFQLYRQVSKLMGGMLPPLLVLPKGSTVLDAGLDMGWSAYELALRNQSWQITGIDRNETVVEQARSLVNEMNNVTVLVHDLQHFEDDIFATTSFELIHLHFLAGEVMLEQFPSFFQSLANIGRPGGFLVWTEAELPITTSLACQRLCALVQQGLQASGYAFSPLNAGNSMEVIRRMEPWLRNAGYSITQTKTFAIDISTGSKGHDAFVMQVGSISEQVRVYLLEAGVTTVTDLKDIFLQIQQEIQEEQFCGLLYLRTLVGVRT